MISFACRQCGQRFDRPDSASGTLVFCACGAGNTVPYESTLPPLRAAEAAPAPFPAPTPRYGSPFEPRPVQRDPTHCLNHPETPQTATCAGCGENYCGDCVLEMEGATLCGPCKNFRVRTGQRPPGLSLAALGAPLVSLVSSLPCMLVLLIGGGFSTSAESFLPWIFVALIPQVIALALGAWGLQIVETNPKFGGHSLAISGLVSAVVVSIFVVGTGVIMAMNKG
jgi:hypothetical protein